MQFLSVLSFQTVISLPFCTQTENPIYRAPETQHPNPLFQGKTQEKSYSLSPTEKEVPVKFS